MTKTQPNWQDYLISFVLFAVALPICFFMLKINLGRVFGFEMQTVLTGMIIGLITGIAITSVILVVLKKPVALPILSVIQLIIWTILLHSTVVTAAIFTSALICTVCSLRCVASALALTHQKKATM